MDGGNFLRMKVVIDINIPLCRGWRISLSHGEQNWVSFKYERLPNICYWCGCLNHVDRDYDLWIESEGNLPKESQAYGAWIHAAPFVKGKSPVLKVSGFYSATKSLQKQIVDGGHEVVQPVDLAGDQPISVEVVQIKKAAKPQNELNRALAVSDAENMIADFVEVVGRDSGETFEKRLEEIDKALSRFDNVSGVTLEHPQQWS